MNDNNKDKNKQVSTFLDFELYKDGTGLKEKIKEANELGWTEKRAKKINKVTFIACALCGWHHILNRTGVGARQVRKRYSTQRRKAFEKLYSEGEYIRSRAKVYNPTKELTFDAVDLHKGAFISVREPGGRGGGMPEIGIVPLSEINKLSKEDKDIIRPLIEQMRSKCTEILEVTKNFK
jgi:hypothetical protein